MPYIETTVYPVFKINHNTHLAASASAESSLQLNYAV